MGTCSLEAFCDAYSEALLAKDAAVFVGAGLSRPSGFVDWKGLLRDIAADLGLDVDKETDLIAVAQYHANKYGARCRLDRLLIEEFTKDAALTDNHRLLANLPLGTVWTTNYDKLLERAFREARKRVDVKVAATALATTVPQRAVTIYKMHGDVSRPQEAVLTKEDYEAYNLSRELFSIKLKGDLVEKTFLFLGFSFTDPNIDYILSRIRLLLGKKTRQHYCIMKRPEKPRRMVGRQRAVYEYARTTLELRTTDLMRYGIKAVLIDSYDEIRRLLEQLNQRCHIKDIFVSGSARSYMPLGQRRVESLARQIGATIIRRGCNLVSGVGLGIGSMVVFGSLGATYAKRDTDVDDRLVLRPFPQVRLKGAARVNLWKKYREDMIAKAGACIFLCGNKLDARTGQVVEADGVLEEFAIAKSLRRYPIPVGVTGHAAHTIWAAVIKSLDTFYPMGGVRDHFRILGGPSSSNRQLLDAICGILSRIGSL